MTLLTAYLVLCGVLAIASIAYGVYEDLRLRIDHKFGPNIIDIWPYTKYDPETRQWTVIRHPRLVKNSVFWILVALTAVPILNIIFGGWMLLGYLNGLRSK